MLDYRVCDTNTLERHLCESMPSGSMSAYYGGVYYEEGVTEEKFREEVYAFVLSCNTARETADGYDMCEDLDPMTGVITFYVMREDGQKMAELSVFFLDENGVGLHARPQQASASCE